MRACRGQWLPYATNWNKLEQCVKLFAHEFIHLVALSNVFHKWENILCHQEIYSLQKEKDEAKQSYDAMEREKLKAERQLEDSSAQVSDIQCEFTAVTQIWSLTC